MRDRPSSEIPWHALSTAEIERLLESSSEGLSEEEAARRRARFGENRLPAPPPPSALLRFLRQFHDVLIYVLLASGVLTLALGHSLDSAAIFGVVLINAIVGFVRESKAERAIAAVGRLLAPRARALRGGRWRELPAEQLVPGDRVRLVAGDRVPADLRLVAVDDLEIDESILTGESLPVAKNTSPQAEQAPLAERRLDGLFGDARGPRRGSASSSPPAPRPKSAASRECFARSSGCKPRSPASSLVSG